MTFLPSETGDWSHHFVDRWHTHANQDETFYMIDGTLELSERRSDVHTPPVTSSSYRGRFGTASKMWDQHRQKCSSCIPPAALNRYLSKVAVSGAGVQPWGPERIAHEFIGLLRKYDCEALPEET
jgi:hypothetical protein